MCIPEMRDGPAPARGVRRPESGGATLQGKGVVRSRAQPVAAHAPCRMPPGLGAWGVVRTPVEEDEILSVRTHTGAKLHKCLACTL